MNSVITNSNRLTKLLIIFFKVFMYYSVRAANLLEGSNIANSNMNLKGFNGYKHDSKGFQ